MSIGLKDCGGLSIDLKDGWISIDLKDGWKSIDLAGWLNVHWAGWACPDEIDCTLQARYH